MNICNAINGKIRSAAQWICQSLPYPPNLVTHIGTRAIQVDQNRREAGERKLEAKQIDVRNHLLDEAHETFRKHKNTPRSYELLKILQASLDGVLDRRSDLSLLNLFQSKGQYWIDDFFALAMQKNHYLMFSSNQWNQTDLSCWENDYLEYLLALLASPTQENAKRLIELGVIHNDPELVNKALDFDPDLVNETVHRVHSIDSMLEFAIQRMSGKAAMVLVQRGAKPIPSAKNAPLILQLLQNFYTPQKKDSGLDEFVRELVRKGVQIDNIIVGTNNQEGGLEVPFIQWLYFNPLLSSIKDLILFETSCKLNSVVCRDIKKQLKNRSELGQALLRRGEITEDELKRLTMVQIPGSMGELLQKAESSTDELEKLLQNSYGNMELADPEPIQKARAIKKELKVRLKDSPIYPRLVSAYDRVVEKHILLRTLRAASRELRKRPRDPSQQLIRMYSLLNEAHIYTGREAKGQIIDSHRTLFDSLYERATTLQKESLESDPLPLLTWVHGTKTGALPGLLRANGFLPLGEIMESNLTVPFCGENCGSDRRLNRNLISGEILSPSFEEQTKEKPYHDASTRLLVSLLYAMKKTGYGRNDKVFDLENAKNLVSVPYLRRLVQNQYYDQISGVKMAALRLKQYDPDADQHLAPAIEYLRTIEEDQDCKEMLLKAFTKEIPLLSAREKEWIKENYPVVFASSTLDPEPMNNKLEYCVPKANLGTDIQYAFTDREQVEKLQQVLAPYKIKVYPFERAFMKELEQMARGSERAAIAKMAHPHSESGRQTRIAWALESEIMPFYSRPLSENPSYIDQNGYRQQIQLPFYGRGLTYTDYAASLQRGAIPRVIHGRVHAARVAIATQMIYRLRNIDAPLSEYTILAAAAHDWMRQDEGIDHWDAESGDRFYSVARNLGASQKEAEGLRKALANKDHSDIFDSLERQLIHDADCLEINRCLSKPDDFRKKQLCFYKDEQIDSEMKEKVIREYQAWVSFTESYEFKRRIEKNTPNTYLAMMRLLKEHAEKFPTLTDLLKTELEAIDAKEAPFKPAPYESKEDD